MSDLQSVFKHIQEIKQRQRSIKKEYRDALAQDGEYQDLLEKLKDQKTRKQQLELKAQESLGRLWAEHDELKDELASEQELLSDLAMKTLMEGKTVEVSDDNDIKYEPLFSVKFKRAQ